MTTTMFTLFSAYIKAGKRANKAEMLERIAQEQYNNACIDSINDAVILAAFNNLLKAQKHAEVAVKLYHEAYNAYINYK